MATKPIRIVYATILALSLFVFQSESAPQAFRRDPGHPQWHHGAFHDVRNTIRSDVRRMLHSRAEVNLLSELQSFRSSQKLKFRFVADKT